MFSRRRDSTHPFRIFFWGCVLLAGLGWLLNSHPFSLSAGDPLRKASVQYADARGDILVVVSEDQAEIAVRAGEYDRSWAWVDLVRQEIGPVSVRDITSLNQEALDAHTIVILTSTATRDSRASDAMEALANFAAAGGTLALELPEGPLRARFAADGSGGWRRPDVITAADGVSPEVLVELQHIPLLTRYRGSTRPLSDARTLLAMDGAPVIYTRDLGEGQLVIFDFEVGALLNRIQQGLPGENYQVSPRRSGEPIRTFDLASTPSLLGSAIPYADLLERYIAHVALGEARPIFSLWPIPDGKSGGLISSHTAGRLEGRPLWMSVHERSSDARTVTFVSTGGHPPNLSDPSLQGEFVGHAAALWHLDPRDQGLYRSYGVPGFHPLRQPLTLVGQLEAIEKGLGASADLRGVRIADGRWGSSFVRPYEAMEAAELRYSATYGPPPGGPSGYLFGTCQPFTPLDERGVPFRLVEVPVCFDNPSSDEDRAQLREALERSQEGPWIVHLLTAADGFRDGPNLPGFDAWREALNYADRTGMWVGGAGEYVSFLRRRAASSLHSERLSGSEGSRSVTWIVEVETDRRGLSLVIPTLAGRYRFESVSRGGPDARNYDFAGQVETETSELLGREIRILALNPGFTTLSITYRAE